MAVKHGHLSKQVLRDYLDNKLKSEVRTSVQRRIQVCKQCWLLYSRIYAGRKSAADRAKNRKRTSRRK